MPCHGAAVRRPSPLHYEHATATNPPHYSSAVPAVPPLSLQPRQKRRKTSSPSTPHPLLRRVLIKNAARSVTPPSSPPKNCAPQATRLKPPLRASVNNSCGARAFSSSDIRNRVDAAGKRTERTRNLSYPSSENLHFHYQMPPSACELQATRPPPGLSPRKSKIPLRGSSPKPS